MLPAAPVTAGAWQLDNRPVLQSCLSVSKFLYLYLVSCLACRRLLSAAAAAFFPLPLLLAARPWPWPGRERPSDSASFSLLLSVTLSGEGKPKQCSAHKACFRRLNHSSISTFYVVSGTY